MIRVQSMAHFGLTITKVFTSKLTRKKEKSSLFPADDIDKHKNGWPQNGNTSLHGGGGGSSPFYP